VATGAPRVLLIPGDGIGPEVAEAALRVLEAACRCCGACVEIRRGEAGDTAARRHGEPLPEETLRLVEWADAILKAPVGETAYDVVVKLRRMLDLYANIRPAKCLPGVVCRAPGIDLVIVRENVEGIYIGVEYSNGETAVALKAVSRRNTERLARLAARIAKERSGRVTIVHKANVLRLTDGLFRSVAAETLRAEGVKVDEVYVDAAAALLVRSPARFDVMLTMNQYGDILSDLAGELAGGLGLAPSANIGGVKALFEPVHGAAWDIAGKGVANPTAMILSAAMMLDWLGYREASRRIEEALTHVLAAGVKTPDLGGSVSTMSYAARIAEEVCRLCSR